MNERKGNTSIKLGVGIIILIVVLIVAIVLVMKFRLIENDRKSNASGDSQCTESMWQSDYEESSIVQEVEEESSLSEQGEKQEESQEEEIWEEENWETEWEESFEFDEIVDTENVEELKEEISQVKNNWGEIDWE